MFKLPGFLLTLYVARAIARGEVAVKSGWRGKTLHRSESAAEFWVAIAVCSGLSAALFTVS